MSAYFSGVFTRALMLSTGQAGGLGHGSARLLCRDPGHDFTKIRHCGIIKLVFVFPFLGSGGL
jgi:hypothetical protein